MPIRGYNKAYQDGGLIDEYSVQVGGTKYPILSDKYKGFLSNKTRNGIAKMNKIKKMSDEQRSEYLGNCNSVLGMDSDRAKADVGDKPSPKNKTKEIQIKDVNVVSGAVNIPMEDIPESIESMVKSVKNELPIEEPSNNASPTPTMAKGGMVKGRVMLWVALICMWVNLAKKLISKVARWWLIKFLQIILKHL